MKKGFTLVELAIVLVVIGMILGMAMKGKQLIDSAKIRAEIAKIKKIETATAMYSSERGLTKEINDLLPQGIISEKDLKSPFHNDTYALAPCTIIQVTAALGPQLLVVNGNHNAPHICLQTSSYLNFSPVLSCYIEKIVDDQSVSTGDGRLYGEINFAPNGTHNSSWNVGWGMNLTNFFTNCDNKTRKAGFLYRLY